MQLIAPDSNSSAILSAVRKPPAAINNQVIASYCPICMLTVTKGY